MGSPYQSQSAAGFNSNPPVDDGSQVASNKITWASTLSKLANPLKTLADAINSALRTALNVTPTSTNIAYTTTTADHLRPIEVTGTTTITLGDAATMVAVSMGYEVPIINVGTGTVTVNLATAANTLAGKANGTMSLAPQHGARFVVNSTGNGYDVAAITNGVIFDATDPTKQIRFDLSNLSAGTVRVITVLDGDASLGWTTGDVKLTIKTTADTGWVLMNDGTIGDASSGATTRANADTSALFTLLWNNTTNANCAVSSGRGASAAADFAAHKTIALPKALGRALAVYGSGSGLTARTLAQTLGEETHVLTVPEMPSHNHALSDGNSVMSNAGGVAFGSTGGNLGITSIANNGGGGAHNNMQPTTFLNVMIKL